MTPAATGQTARGWPSASACASASAAVQPGARRCRPGRRCSAKECASCHSTSGSLRPRLDRNTPVHRAASPGAARAGPADRVPEQQLQQQRHVADHLDIDRGDLGQQPVLRQPGDADQGAEDGRQDDADDGDLQRVQQADGQRAADRCRPGCSRSRSRRSAGRPRGRGSRSRWRCAATSRLWTGVGPEPPDDGADDADDQHLPDDGAHRVRPTRTGAAAAWAAARSDRRVDGGLRTWRALLSRGQAWAECRGRRSRPAPRCASAEGGEYCSPPLVQSAFGPRWMPIGFRVRSNSSP